MLRGIFKVRFTRYGEIVAVREWTGRRLRNSTSSTKINCGGWTKNCGKADTSHTRSDEHGYPTHGEGMIITCPICQQDTSLHCEDQTG